MSRERIYRPELDPMVLLEKAEAAMEEYYPLVDKVPMEEKLLQAHEEELNSTLEPYEIQEVVQIALSNLPEGLEDHVDLLFDVIYEAISEALNRVRLNRN